MNIRNVLRTYSLLRQLTDDESALLETLRNATDAERELLVETLAPQRTTTKRAGKKSGSKSASKSSRASGMAATLKKSLEQQRRVTKGDDDADNGKKGMAGPLCQTCGNFEQHEDHSHPSPHHHEFDAGKSSAPRAGAKSSTNGGASDDEQVSAASGD